MIILFTVAVFHTGSHICVRFLLQSFSFGVTINSNTYFYVLDFLYDRHIHTLEKDEGSL